MVSLHLFLCECTYTSSQCLLRRTPSSLYIFGPPLKCLLFFLKPTKVRSIGRDDLQKTRKKESPEPAPVVFLKVEKSLYFEMNLNLVFQPNFFRTHKKPRLYGQICVRFKDGLATSYSYISYSGGLFQLFIHLI
jgi:hypothetical protein